MARQYRIAALCGLLGSGVGSLKWIDVGWATRLPTIATFWQATPALFFPSFRLPLNKLIFCQSRRFAAYHEQGKGLFILGLRDGFCARKQTMQGANRSKVEHLARIGNAVEAVLWRKAAAIPNINSPATPAPHVASTISHTISGCLNGASAARRHGCQQAQRDCQPTSPRHQQTATTLLLAHTLNLPIFRLPFTHAITPPQKAA